MDESTGRCCADIFSCFCGEDKPLPKVPFSLIAQGKAMHITEVIRLLAALGRHEPTPSFRLLASRFPLIVVPNVGEQKNLLSEHGRKQQISSDLSKQVLEQRLCASVMTGRVSVNREKVLVTSEKLAALNC